MSPPPVSVIIATHTERRWDQLLRAIASAQGQQPPPSEVIVAVDHNERLSDRLRAHVREIEVVDHAGVRGAGATRNSGAAHAHGEVLAFLDDDVEAHDGWLAALIAPLADPEVVGCGGKTLPSWRARHPRWFPDEFAWVVGGTYAGMPTTVSPIRNVWSENMAVRREAFAAVGGFRPGFGKLGLTSITEDDTDLCIRVAAAAPGTHWTYVPDAIVDHDVPFERSTFRYFLRRCYLEGAGKVQLSAYLGAERALSDERVFVRRTVPRALLRALCAGELGRALALVTGVVAAAIGGGVAVARVRLRW
jgi:GT2 family glycosyltransferase